MPSCDDLRFAIAPASGSERGDIQKHIEEYQALQRKRILERNAHCEREMARIRTSLKAPPKSG
jgi:hypothetical protein